MQRSIVFRNRDTFKVLVQTSFTVTFGPLKSYLHWNIYISKWFLDTAKQGMPKSLFHLFIFPTRSIEHAFIGELYESKRSLAAKRNGYISIQEILVATCSYVHPPARLSKIVLSFLLWGKQNWPTKSCPWRTRGLAVERDIFHSSA